MSTMPAFVKSAWDNLNPKHPKPGFLVAFFLFAVAVFTLGLWLGHTI